MTTLDLRENGETIHTTETIKIRDPIAVATERIHEAVSGITILESIALLEVAAAYYKTHVIDQIKAKQESIYVPTPDDRSDVV